MRVSRKQVAFIGGMSALALALSPPLADAARQLFAFHMTQHLLVIAVAAPLLAASRVFEPARSFASLSDPRAAWISFVSVFLFWHWPAAFRWAAGNEATQLLEHGSILIGALLFWSAALSPKTEMNDGGRALYIMTAAIATDLPGVIMVFAPVPICTMPNESSWQWGLSPLQDQEIAGMLMWVPANLVFFGIATWLFARWISDTRSHYVEVL